MKLPTDENDQVMQITPDRVALARTVNGSLASTVEITLQGGTDYIRCYATGQDVYLKWGTADATSSNFDEVLPVNQLVDLKVPINQTTDAKFTAFNIIERAASANIVVIEK